jgi:hypothetical protein
MLVERYIWDGCALFRTGDKMTVLVMVLDQKKSDVVNALKMKSRLWDNGVILSGMVLRGEDKGLISHRFLEDMMQLKVIGSLQEN